jgi:hypothetical protein
MNISGKKELSENWNQILLANKLYSLTELSQIYTITKEFLKSGFKQLKNRGENLFFQSLLLIWDKLFFSKNV